MKKDGGAACKTFTGPGGAAEHYIFVSSGQEGAFARQLKAVEDRYAGALRGLGLDPDTAVFRRIFLSDLRTQAEQVRRGALAALPGGGPVSVSIVRQPPLPGGKIALLAYHVAGAPPLRRRLSPFHVLTERNGLGHLWSTGLLAPAAGESPGPGEQTREVFGALARALEGRGGTLGGSCVRTWIYLRDMDAHYKEMVDARRELFEGQGLTADTHYISSTGIEGACGGRQDLVAMDAYSILGLRPGQVSYMNAFDRLCPAKDYAVTFERGTSIAYADRAHHFISGTASIDGAGRIVHPGNVLKQLERAVENIGALLRSGRAGLSDLMYLIVYLRDPADAGPVSVRLGELFPGLPAALVQGAVCRPGWLVEAEGVAITRASAPSLPVF